MHILIPQTCKYHLTWQRDLVDVITLRNLRAGDDFELSKWAQSDDRCPFLAMCETVKGKEMNSPLQSSEGNVNLKTPWF